MSLSLAELSKLFTIAHAAGRVIMDVYRRDFTTRTKDDRSPVTEADVAAENLILAQLLKSHPQTPVIAEETAASGTIPKINSEFFLVDPLDGTKEFINRNGEFTVNIALIRGSEPVAGVIYAPAIGEAYCGATGTGAFSAQVSEEADSSTAAWTKISVNATRPRLIAIASRSHRDIETEELLSRIKPAEIVSRGSSLKFCTVASGAADIYPRFGRTMEWDTAAGQAILEAAGGQVTDIQGQRLLYGKTSAGYANPAYIAFGTAEFPVC
jgi:3'(2'), 5'-bisphosphate nucleotidase